jgi:hypothetical protein
MTKGEKFLWGGGWGVLILNVIIFLFGLLVKHKFAWMNLVAIGALGSAIIVARRTWAAR